MLRDVKVEANDLWPALKTIAKFANTRAASDAVVVCDKGFLIIELPGPIVEIVVEGGWVSRASDSQVSFLAAGQ